MTFLCTLVNWLFLLPQFLVNILYGVFGATVPDLSAAFDSIFGCTV